MMVMMNNYHVNCDDYIVVVADSVVIFVGGISVAVLVHQIRISFEISDEIK